MFSKIVLTAAALAGAAYATTGETVTTASAVHTVKANDSTVNGTDTYTFYQGDGSGDYHWPTISQWTSYSAMLQNNIPIMRKSCADLGYGDNDSDAEIEAIATAIDKVAAETFVDHRFILAIIMQESKGCVRVQTTSYSVANPGLMQDHAGSSTCNSGTGSSKAVSPCPDTEIYGMVSEGTAGTSTGDGLANCLNQAQGINAQPFYRAARIYNSGSIDPSGDLGKGVATHCYASDVANRLTGWVSAKSTCTLDSTSS